MAQAKGSYGAGLGEERLGLCTPLYALREYAETLEAGCQPKPRKLYQRPDGQYVAEVLPRGSVSCLSPVSSRWWAVRHG